MIHMDWNARIAYYVAGHCILYVKALKDKEKLNYFQLRNFVAYGSKELHHASTVFA